MDIGKDGQVETVLIAAGLEFNNAGKRALPISDKYNSLKSHLQKALIYVATMAHVYRTVGHEVRVKPNSNHPMDKFWFMNQNNSSITLN